jgi:hypothetical protein
VQYSVSAYIPDLQLYDYIRDIRYAGDRNELWRAYKLIEKDLLRLFEYVEPTDDNLETYSHRTYELILRAATEFETNCKRILEANGYQKNGNLNMSDYFKINAASKLHEYTVSLTVWSPAKKDLSPFGEWANEKNSLSWYQAYNLVKHDRNRNFPKASLENLLNCVAGLLAILFSQFCVVLGDSTSFSISDDWGIISQPDHIFEVTPPTTWTESERYEFEWEKIKDEPNPFVKFEFPQNQRERQTSSCLSHRS